MTALSRRKKALPVEDESITFTIVIDAQEIVVSYRPHWMQDVGHFEFRSPQSSPVRSGRAQQRGDLLPVFGDAIVPSH
jgi:hypothetical protein